MAIGFSVDYIAHIGESFSVHQGTRKERAAAAVSTMGGSVLAGGGSTFLSMMLLAFSKSNGFLTLYRMFTGIIGWGLLTGLVFMPVVLSLVGPSFEPDDDTEGARPEELDADASKPGLTDVTVRADGAGDQPVTAASSSDVAVVAM
mmetsp:Transcript_82753/g.200580  ORF Transcript_82753/g.200580 Transcript_82753/m.200580 type:complete len:146 (+) Transcript_82753:1-438(+)